MYFRFNKYCDIIEKKKWCLSLDDEKYYLSGKCGITFMYSLTASLLDDSIMKITFNIVASSTIIVKIMAPYQG